MINKIIIMIIGKVTYFHPNSITCNSIAMFDPENLRYLSVIIVSVTNLCHDIIPNGIFRYY